MLFSHWYWLQTFHALDQTMLIYLSASIEKVFWWRPGIDITLEKDYDFLYEIVSFVFLFDYELLAYEASFYFENWNRMKCNNRIYLEYLCILCKSVFFSIRQHLLMTYSAQSFKISHFATEFFGCRTTMRWPPTYSLLSGRTLSIMYIAIVVYVA